MSFSIKGRRSRVGFKSGIPVSVMLRIRKEGRPTLYQYCNRCKTERVHRRCEIGIECISCNKITLI